MHVLSDIDVLLTQVRSCLDAGNHKQAKRVLRRCLKLDEGHLPTLELTALTQCRCGQPSDALSTISRLVILNPFEPGYDFLRGCCLQSLGRFLEAEACYRRAAKAVGPEQTVALEATSRLETWKQQCLEHLLAENSDFRAAFARDVAASSVAAGISLQSQAMLSASTRQSSKARNLNRPS